MTTTQTDSTSETDQVVDARVAARRRVQAKRDFGSHLVSYVVVNAFLVGIWAITGAGYFWPAWVLVCWGSCFTHGTSTGAGPSLTQTSTKSFAATTAEIDRRTRAVPGLGTTLDFRGIVA